MFYPQEEKEEKEEKEDASDAGVAVAVVLDHPRAFAEELFVTGARLTISQFHCYHCARTLLSSMRFRATNGPTDRNNCCNTMGSSDVGVVVVVVDRDRLDLLARPSHEPEVADWWVVPGYAGHV